MRKSRSIGSKTSWNSKQETSTGKELDEKEDKHGNMGKKRGKGEIILQFKEEKSYLRIRTSILSQTARKRAGRNSER